MNIDISTVKRVAELARLNLSEAEMEAMRGDMSKIMAYMDKMNEVDTQGVEPLIFLSEEVNSLRNDTPEAPLTQEQALANAPQKNSDYFKVPKVIERA